MARQETVLTAFVASPSDVADERALLEEIVREINLTWSRQFGVRIELLKWETHTYPAVGTDAQAIINEQIGDDYDIFIGIMWARFGTKTPRNESGTEEEFERAYSRHEREPNSVRIMFYFKDAPLPPSKVDATQLAKVFAFKKKLGEEGAYHWSFNDREQFGGFLRLHLSRVIQDWQKHTRQPEPSSIVSQVAKLPPDSAGLEESEERGFLDFLEASVEAIALATSSIEKMSAANLELGTAIEERGKELEAVKQPTGEFDLQAAKRASNKAALDMEVFVTRTEVELPIFSKSYRTAVEELGKAVNLGVQDFDANLESVQSLRDALATHSAQIPDTIDRLKGLRDSVAGCPRLTAKFNKAKRRTVQVLERLLSELESAFQMNRDVVKLLDDIVAGF